MSRLIDADHLKNKLGVWWDKRDEVFAEMIDECPTINPQEPKAGHWILDETDNSITCDKCGCLIWANDISNGEAYYCPNCGCRMVEPQESEEV